MKKNYFGILALLITSIFVFSSCSNDDDNDSNEAVISYEELPTLSQQFIKDHFRDYTVEKAVKGTASYNVVVGKQTQSNQTASSDYIVEFAMDGKWIEIEGRNDSALPDNVLALLPRPITSYVVNNYADRKISEIKKEDYGYKIELTGKPDIDLQFDVQGNFISSDSDNEAVISLGELPVISQTFLSTHFNNVNPTQIIKDADGYEVIFSSKLELEFDLTGEFKKVDANGNNIPQTIIALLPDQLTNYLTVNYAGNRIEDIEIKVSSYKIELQDGTDLIFDKSGKLWSDNSGAKDSDKDERVEFVNLPDNIKSYLNQYFLTEGQTSFLYAEKDNNEYEIRLANGTEIDFDINGNMIKISVLSGNAVPQAVILPAISAYVQSNYSDKKIEELEIKVNRGYKIELSGYPETELLFDSNGNFIGLD